MMFANTSIMATETAYGQDSDPVNTTGLKYTYWYRVLHPILARYIQSIYMCAAILAHMRILVSMKAP